MMRSSSALAVAAITLFTLTAALSPTGRLGLAPEAAKVSPSAESGLDMRHKLLQGLSGLQELKALDLAVKNAQHATGSRFPTSASSDRQVQLNSNSDFARVVVKTFPAAGCVRRTGLGQKIPLHMKDAPTSEPQVFGTSPGNCPSGRVDHSENTPAVCVFSHAFVNALGEVCDTAGCLLNKPFENTNKFMGNSFISCDDFGCSKASPDDDLQVHDVVYSLAQHNDVAISSFMGQGALRLAVGLDYLLDAGKSVPIHVRNKTSELVQAMEAIGISADRIISGDLKARALIYPEPVYQNKVSDTMVQFARWSVRKQLNLGLPTESHTRLPLVLVIKKSKDAASNLVNHDILVQSLRAELKDVHVQDIEDLGKLSVQDAMRFIASSAVVVAPAGAGLHNLIAASPGGAVVEIMPGVRCDSAQYAKTGVALGLNYNAFYADKAAYDGNMKVNADELVPIVALAVQAVKTSWQSAAPRAQVLVAKEKAEAEAKADAEARAAAEQRAKAEAEAMAQAEAEAEAKAREEAQARREAAARAAVEAASKARAEAAAAAQAEAEAAARAVAVAKARAAAKLEEEVEAAVHRVEAKKLETEAKAKFDAGANGSLEQQLEKVRAKKTAAIEVEDYAAANAAKAREQEILAQLGDLGDELKKVQAEKKAAIEAEDFGAANVARQREKAILAKHA